MDQSPIKVEYLYVYQVNYHVNELHGVLSKIEIIQMNDGTNMHHDALDLHDYAQFFYWMNHIRAKLASQYIKEEEINEENVCFQA